MNIFETALNQLLTEVAKESTLQKADLERRWKHCLTEALGGHSEEISTTTTMESTTTNEHVVPPPTATSKRTKSAYQYFFSFQQVHMKQSNPLLNFGELSKQISQQWKIMSLQEREQWFKDHLPDVDITMTRKEGGTTRKSSSSHIIPSPTTAVSTSPQQSEAPPLTVTELKKLSMAELRRLCIHHQIPSHGNRIKLLNTLESTLFLRDTVEKVSSASTTTTMTIATPSEKKVVGERHRSGTNNSRCTIEKNPQKLMSPYDNVEGLICFEDEDDDDDPLEDSFNRVEEGSDVVVEETDEMEDDEDELSGMENDPVHDQAELWLPSMEDIEDEDDDEEENIDDVDDDDDEYLLEGDDED